MTARLTPRLALAGLAALAAFVLSPAALGQGGPPPEVRAAIQSVERMLQGTDDASAQQFAAEHLAPAYRGSFTPEALQAHLKTLRDAVGGQIGGLRVEREDDGLHLTVMGAHEVTFLIGLDPAYLITKLELIGTAPPTAASPADEIWKDTTWETLPADLHRAEAAGFSGVYLARHDGKEVARGSFGVADKPSGRRTAADTIYCIGSTPIDFTVSGILLLAQRGKLSLDDPISKYLPDVPADKRPMTLRHILTGKSGLPNFHHTEKDWDADLGWIDRDTAMRRILGAKLLFAPGAQEEHSHSAYGLLAMIIENVSGTSYPAFVRSEILKPLGMTRTGFYGETLGLGVSDFATGYGASSAGLPNIPPNWGPTSWLVMGSGGMFSTLPDMERYYAALEGGRLLTGEWAKWQQGGNVGVGGSDRGFFIFHATNGHGNEILFLMNGEGRAAQNRAMARAGERLVMGR
jgi:CubicO group peptidase (beta-lactamase class C family)